MITLTMIKLNGFDCTLIDCDNLIRSNDVKSVVVNSYQITTIVENI